MEKIQFHGISINCRELPKPLLQKKLLIQLAQLIFLGLISKLISSGYPSNEKEIEDCIKFAGACGLLTCLGEGAIEQQPYYEKVNKF